MKNFELEIFAELDYAIALKEGAHMKKIIIIALLAMLCIGTAEAVTRPTEDDYRSLDQLRSELVRMRREMDRFMKDVVMAYPEETVNFGQEIRVDVAQTANEMIVKADIPGIDKDKIDITLEKNKILKISGAREALKKESAPGVVKQERMEGRFERVLELPAEGMSEGIKATYKNGVLELIIPKKPKTEEETVKIKVQ